MMSMETIGIILKQMPGLSGVGKKFSAYVFVLFLSIKGRMNFMNMSGMGNYSEKSYRIHFEPPFDFFNFN
ncbi:hypothetical protein QUF75_17125 [Desulfococcaceae bacterium HSG7]|nr:hypothetical protein [Desulfococcaceae bacterium HSG7]